MKLRVLKAATITGVLMMVLGMGAANASNNDELVDLFADDDPDALTLGNQYPSAPISENDLLVDIISDDVPEIVTQGPSASQFGSVAVNYK